MTTTRNFQNRFLCLILTVLAIISLLPTKAFASDSDQNGWGFVTSRTPVYNAHQTAQIGYLDANEGFTVKNAIGNYYHIYYSTPSQASKEGYVEKSAVTLLDNETCYGMISGSTTTYYSNNSNSVVAGSVNAAEHVAVLARSNGFTYIEYDTTSGRKRGWVSDSNIAVYNANRLRRYFKDCGYTPDNAAYGKAATVYKVPNTFSSSVNGSISANEKIKIYSTAFTVGNNKFYYIEYIQSSTGKTKSGYVLA